MTTRSDKRQFAHGSASYRRSALEEGPTQAADPEMALILGEVVRAGVMCLAQISRDLYVQSSKGDGSFGSEKAKEKFSVALRNAGPES